MADIKITKKGGSLWWLWALIALVVIGILLWIFLDNDRGNGVVEAPAVVAAPVNAVANADMNPVDQTNAIPATQPITDLATITNSTDNSLVGRDVNLSGVPVGKMAGDASFWVDGADGKQVYVVLNEVKTPGTAMEGEVNVTQGANVDVMGKIRSARDGAPEGAAAGTRTDPLPAGVDKYIYAQSATVAR